MIAVVVVVVVVCSNGNFNRETLGFTFPASVVSGNSQWNDQSKRHNADPLAGMDT